jgi:hypothetical protein
MGYTDDLIIDSSKLDEEWERQPILFMQYADSLADAEKKRNEVSDELDYLKSKIDLSIRSGQYPDAEGLKLTEKLIESLVSNDSEIVKKKEELNKAKYEYLVLKGAVEAFSQRKKALEKLVDLFVFGYNASPKSDIDRIRDIKKRRREELGENDEG